MALRFSLFFASLFAALGVYLPFWPLWLEAQGLSPVLVAVLVAAPVGVRVIATPWIARAVDRRGQRRPAIILLAWCSALAFAAFPLAGSFVPLLLLSLLFGATYSTLAPLGDHLAMRIATRDGLHYGRVRLWGSLGFLALTVGAGAALEESPVRHVHGMTLVCLVLCALAAHALPDVRDDEETNPEPVTLRRLLGRRDIVFVLLACALVQGSHGAYNAFSALHWEAAGLGEGTIGLLWAEGVVAEIVLFSAGTALVRRAGPARLLLVGAIGATLRWVGTAWTTAVPILLVLQLGHALSFGATHLAGLELLARRVPAAAGATGQSLLTASTGLALAAATLAAGPLYRSDPAAAFLAMAVVALAAVVPVVQLLREPAPPPRPAPRAGP